MFVLINDYLKYSIVSEVNMVKHRHVRPPAFSLCIPYIEDINWTSMGWDFTTDQWINLDRIERDALTMQLQQNWTIRNIFQETYDLQTFKTGGWIRRTDSYEVEREDEYMYIKKYLRDDFVCFRIYHSDIKRETLDFSYESHHVAYGEEAGGLFSISLNKARLMQVTKLSIFLHPNDIYPRGDADFPFNSISTNHSTIFGNGSTYFGLTYTQMTIHSLPPPFRTRCFNYHFPEKRFESQQHCIDHCMRRRVLEKFNESSFTTTFTEPEDYRIMSKYSVHISRPKENRVDMIYQSCLKECPMIECHQVRYLPALMATRDSNDVTFVLNEPNGPEMIIIFLPKLTLMELYVQVMSICGVWLGVSLADVVIRGMKVVLVRNKKPRKEVTGLRRVTRLYY